MTGRSIYYGALLYLGDLTGGFWLTVALQSGAVLATLLLAIRAIGLKLWPMLPVLGAFLAAFTTAPFFASFLMPDLFAGVAIFTAATVLARGSGEGWYRYLGAFALLVISAVVHDSHFLILATMLAFAAIWNLATRSWENWRGLAVLGATLGVALLAQTFFSVAVEHVVGAPPMRPPFLMARLIDDGPGYRYLRATCPENGFKVCEYLDRLPLASDEFLWSPAPDHGVFAAADPATRRQLCKEQMRFALGVLIYDPAGTLRTAADNAAAQLLLVGLDEFNIDESEKRAFKLPKEYLPSVQRSAAYREAMPVVQCTAIVLAVLVMSVALIAWALISPEARKRLSGPLVKMSLWTAAGVLVNAAVCGAMSGPHMRYSARVDWIIPMIAVLIATVEIQQWRFAPFLGTGRAPAAAGPEQQTPQ